MINKVILVGNVGADPEIRTIESGVKVARIRMVTSERIFNRQSNQTREHSEWHTVIMWRGLADVADKYVRKGSQIYIEGNLRTRDWVDKDNVKHTTTEIVAYELKMLGRRPDSASAPAQQGVSTSTQSSAVDMPTSVNVPSPADDPDDLPF